MGPQARIAVRLQLKPDAQLVAFDLTDTTAQLLYLTGCAEQLLHVMSHLVGDDIGAREVATGSQPLIQFVEERKIDEDALVRRAIERSHGGFGKAAAGIDGAAEQHEFRLTVTGRQLRHDRLPDGFGVRQHDGDLLASFGLVSRFPVGLHRIRSGTDPGCLHTAQQHRRVDAEIHADQHDGNHADSADAGAAADAHAAPVLDIVALPASLPAHRAASAQIRA